MGIKIVREEAQSAVDVFETVTDLFSDETTQDLLDTLEEYYGTPCDVEGNE